MFYKIFHHPINMLEAIINPKSAETGVWKMFFVGFLYSSLSLLLVRWFFFSDPVLVKYSGILVVLLCVMFTLHFMYYLIKNEEEKGQSAQGIMGVLTIHKKAIYGFVLLFLGFVIAFSFWYLILGDTTMLNAQLETYCSVNNPRNFDICVSQYSRGDGLTPTGSASSGANFLRILENNLYVLIFTLMPS